MIRLIKNSALILLFLLFSCRRSESVINLTVVDCNYINSEIFSNTNGTVIINNSKFKSSFELLFYLEKKTKRQYFYLNRIKDSFYTIRSNAIFPNENEEHILQFKRTILIEEKQYFILETTDNQVATFKVILDSQFKLLSILFPAGSCFIYSINKTPKENLNIIRDNFLPYNRPITSEPRFIQLI